MEDIAHKRYTKKAAEIVTEMLTHNTYSSRKEALEKAITYTNHQLQYFNSVKSILQERLNLEHDIDAAKRSENY